ncbi:hypothetical protein [Candidatus Stoquefichus sp. SB1]|uniref:hypothetical protein n=1 Tax=Candidatus Stoquefichus sp. SB1 TaxID=1658109 RepID=UPI00067F4C9B|nr:hypothetical protein [Candidatus Stoquefichus sp. SB1]
MKKKHHYVRNTFFVVLVIFTILGIVIQNILFTSHYDYLMSAYLGTIMPLQSTDSSLIICERETSISVQNIMQIQDQYHITNKTSKNQTIHLSYPCLRESGLTGESMDIQLNQQSINYQIQLSGLFAFDEKSTSQDFIKGIESSETKTISQEFAKKLQEKVYVYQFVNREYPDDGPIRYLEIEYDNYLKTYDFYIENQDNRKIIYMDNDAHAITPVIISYEKIKGMKLTGYSDESCSKVDKGVTAQVKETEMTFQDAIKQCLDDYISKETMGGQNQWNREAFYLSYFCRMDKLYQKDQTLNEFDLQALLFDEYFCKFYTEIEVPANKTVTVSYNYQNAKTNIQSDKGKFHYMTNYLSDIEFTKQSFSIILDNTHTIQDNSLGLIGTKHYQTIEVPFNQDQYFIQLEKNNVN